MKDLFKLQVLGDRWIGVADMHIMTNECYVKDVSQADLVFILQFFDLNNRLDLKVHSVCLSLARKQHN